MNIFLNCKVGLIMICWKSTKEGVKTYCERSLTLGDMCTDFSWAFERLLAALG